MIWYTEKDDGYYFGGKEERKKFNYFLEKRKETFPCLTDKYGDIIDEIKTKGYSIISNVFSDKVIKNLNLEFKEKKEKGEISLEDDHYLMLSDPLYISKTAFDIATSDIVVDIASEFYGCTPFLCTQNFRLTKLNNLPPKTTQLFHADQNSAKFIKFFVYLNDVDENTGPFVYVDGSNKNKFEHHLTKYRWDEKEIEYYYGKENIKLITAKAGDLIIAQTTGFHKGKKPINKERTMLTINYLIHEENGMSKKFKVKKEWVNELNDPIKKNLFDFMEIVE